MEMNERKQSEQAPYENKYVNALDMIASIELVFSTLFGLYILFKYSKVEVMSSRYGRFTDTVWNGAGIGVGIGLIIQGIVIYVVLSTIKVIAEDVSEVKRTMVKRDEKEYVG